MIVTVHQPIHLPYLGYFYKMAQSDLMVIYDTAQFVKGYAHNRQRVRTNTGWTWITVPLENSLSSFLETRISYKGKPWNESHWKTIAQSYGKTPYFNSFKERFEELYTEKPLTLAECNVARILLLKEYFGLEQKILFMSECGIPDSASASEKLATVTQQVGGSVYLSGPSGRKYLDFEPFRRRGIQVAFSDFTHPLYPQYHTRFDGRFEPNMGAIDCLFNNGTLPFPTKVPISVRGSHDAPHPPSYQEIKAS